ncbi:MAG: sigma-54-dependent Fis family transcriptional regulator [Nitrospirae bacterium]|nr:sigma-54-dependent Fis family transcriptional regulator [Nitrospirota bacterium]
MSKKTILIVDDEEGIRDTLSGIFEDEGYEVLTAKSGEEALEIINEQAADLALLDIWMPGIDGIETLTQIKSIAPNMPVIMISGHGNIDLAVNATRLGAYDFLEKPLSLDKVLIVAKRALESRKLQEENRQLKINIERKSSLIGNSSVMVQLRQQIELAAQSSSRVLILGESGTGKELAAKLLHEKSPRASESFVEVNCAAIPQELIESELFGHEKGSFTGAAERKTGKFELADRGTLFLDEIGDMTLSTQAKVLRVIETQVFQRVGGNKSIKVDVRIVAATNKNLTEEVKAGNFREDLFFRLNVIPISLPPLRERREDLPMLIEHFISMFSSEYGLKPKTLNPDVLKIFKDHDWPGNIRELKNIVERLMIMIPSSAIDKSSIEGLALFKGQQATQESDYFSSTTLRDARDAFEKEFLIRKLAENNWNVSKTAEAIEIERSNLHKKIKAFDIMEPKEL